MLYEIARVELHLSRQLMPVPRIPLYDPSKIDNETLISPLFPRTGPYMLPKPAGRQTSQVLDLRTACQYIISTFLSG